MPMPGLQSLPVSEVGIPLHVIKASEQSISRRVRPDQSNLKLSGKMFDCFLNVRDDGRARGRVIDRK